MTRNEALYLLHDYCLLLWRNAKISALRPVLADARRMSSRFPSTGSKAKAMRWLGYMQGVLVATRVFTLDEVKRHAKNKQLSPE